MNYELEKYLDSDTFEIFNVIFSNDEELNREITKDTLKYIISKASVKTIKKLFKVKINVMLCRITYIVTHANLFEVDNSIEHMDYMLKRQYINLKKLSFYIDKANSIEKLKNIYLNANAMISLSESSIKYYNDLIRTIELKDQRINYYPNYDFNIAVNETEMDTITSNIKKLAK